MSLANIKLKENKLPWIRDFSVDSNNKAHWLRVEYTCGCLEEKIREPFPLEVVISWGKSLLGQLKEMSTNKLYLGEISPKNLFITEGNMLKIFPLNQAKAVSMTEKLAKSETVDPKAIFDEPYLPPEYSSLKALNAGMIEKIEVYQFGLLMYQLLAASSRLMLKCHKEEKDFARNTLEASASIRPGDNQRSIKTLAAIVQECIYEDPGQRSTIDNLIICFNTLG